MTRDPTQRFSTRVEDYRRYRPSYPPGVLELLERECSLTSSSVVADIGSGTGLLSELLLQRGCTVVGVEPNAEMREAGERILSRWPLFRSVSGRAENTMLEPASFDLITAGQAFHWFEPAGTRREFQRILKPGGFVALVWNERISAGDPFLEGYESLLHRFAPDYSDSEHGRGNPATIASFFGPSPWKTASYANRQWLDLQGVRGRLRSSSYVPQPGTDGYAELLRGIEALFAKHQRDGRIALTYETRVYYGPLL